MGVDSLHPSYLKHRKTWRRNRACFEGEEAIKAGGTEFLPMLGYHRTETNSEAQHSAYNTYKQGAIWFDGTYRTVTAMSGLVFRKQPFIFGKDSLLYKDDFSVDNKSLSAVAKQLVQEITLQGRVGLLVSYPEINTTKMTKKQVSDQKIHAYSAVYKTEDIINWRVEKRRGRMVATMVVLKEAIARAEDGDMFDTEMKEQYRVLYINKDDNTYHQAMYSSHAEIGQASYDKSEVMSLISDIQPLRNGKALEEIPFYPITPSGISWEIERSPMNGVCAANVGHYINSALYESGLSLTASPTLILKGYQADGEGADIVLGGNNAISLGIDGGAEFLEYKGQGMNGIADAMKEKKVEMAVMGVKILTAEKQSNTSAEAIGLEQTGEQAVLASIAHSASDALTLALKDMISWDNAKANTKDVRIELNTDFTPNSLTANQLNALTVLHSKLGLSDEEMFEALKRGEIVPSEMTFAEHTKQIEESRLFEIMGTAALEDPLKHLTVDANRLTKPDAPGKPNATSINKGAPTNSGGSASKQ